MVCSGCLALNCVLGYARKGILCEGSGGLDCFYCLKSIGKIWKVLGPFLVSFEDHLKNMYCDLTETSFLLIAILWNGQED